jgi:hypothetical protein
METIDALSPDWNLVPKMAKAPTKMGQIIHGRNPEGRRATSSGTVSPRRSRWNCPEPAR